MTDKNALLTKLLEKNYTKQELIGKLRTLREFLERKYFSGVSEVSRKDLRELDDKFINAFNKKNAYLLLKKIEADLNTIEPIHLYLPIEVKDAELEKLGTWFKKNVSKMAILELHLDQALTLGCAVAYKGVYRDFSLKYYIKSYRKEIAAILDKYEKEQ